MSKTPAASLTPVRDVVSGADTTLLRPAVRPGDIPARHALDRVLERVGRTTIGVVGRQSVVVAEWLRRTGRDAEALTLPGTPNGRGRTGTRAAKHSVIVAIDCIEYTPDPGVFLRDLRQMLARDGRIITVVPNIRHASVRVAMLLGHYPLSAVSPQTKRPFTAAEIEGVLEDAGFSVTAVEREVDQVEILKEIGADVPEAVLGVLAADADALTSYFAVLGEVQRSGAVGLLHRRLRDIEQEQQATTRKAEQLGHRIEALEARNLEQVDRAQDDRTQADTARALISIARLDEGLRTMTERVSARAAADVDRDAALRQAREPLIASVGQIKALITKIERGRYRRLIPRVHRFVSSVVPRGSIVAVISRGDHELLAFERRKGWHFPQTNEGVYAGHHPADSKAAVAHLEQLRARGAQYLLIPRTSFWWLEHYREFNEHLLRRYRCVLRDEHTCAVFALGRGQVLR